ncbi:MAG TPA: FAD-dependent oxidoreductase, partial [Chitinophagaceae bacterium]|nr:FAD-dependent oxidoreductase [Chitinophagaceae bacterium]
MKRDGACNSLWQDTTPEYYSKMKALPTQLFDVIIAGGGITGITTGLLLQRSGLSVMIAEAQSIGFGTTGGTTAHLNTFVDASYDVVQQKFGKKNGQLLARALKQALQLIKRNVQEYEINCGYKELPGYLFSQDSDQSKKLRDIMTATQECNVNASWIEEIPVPINFENALLFPGQATFHPTRYLSSLAKEFEKAGGVLLDSCRITLVEEGLPHSLKSSRGNFRCSHFIYATHIPPGVNLLHFRCAPYRSYVMAAQLGKTYNYPEALIYDMYDPYHYYRSQEIDGEKYFIVGGEDHKTGHEENTERCFRKLEAHIKKYFGVTSIANRWSSQYFEPADGLPYIGNLPGHPANMYVATGYGGNGMVYSAVAALTLTDMIRGINNENIELFDPNRIKMVAGFSNFVKESADVIGKLAKKILPAEKLAELADLAYGEARVVHYEGSRLAIYKNENGQVFALNSACTHIRCEVAWNSAEKTWDCPCHGSRFSYKGEMLTAPARKDLETVLIGIN